MTATGSVVTALFEQMGAPVTFHREDNGTSCPCRTPEGFRDPSWHRANPAAPVCNEQGFLSSVILDIQIKAVINPPRMRGNRGADRTDALLGEVQAGDRIGIFPCSWQGFTLKFEDWSDAGEDYVIMDGKRYVVVESAKVTDIDGDPNGHWECGLRLVKSERPTDAT
jgi:hypothetical protein